MADFFRRQSYRQVFFFLADSGETDLPTQVLWYCCKGEKIDQTWLNGLCPDRWRRWNGSSGWSRIVNRRACRARRRRSTFRLWRRPFRIWIRRTRICARRMSCCGKGSPRWRRSDIRQDRLSSRMLRRRRHCSPSCSSCRSTWLLSGAFSFFHNLTGSSPGYLNWHHFCSVSVGIFWRLRTAFLWIRPRARPQPPSSPTTAAADTYFGPPKKVPFSNQSKSISPPMFISW